MQCIHMLCMFFLCVDLDFHLSYVNELSRCCFLKFITVNEGSIQLGVDGSNVSSIDAAAPSAAWMVGLIDDDMSVPSLHWCTRDVEITFNGEKIKVSVPGLSSVPPVVPGTNTPEAGVCVVKTIAGEKFAVLKRGLV